MLTKYMNVAMHRAKYEILSDGTFYGEIRGFQGVYANSDVLESCREQLQEVLEDWIVLGLRLGHELPIVEDIQLTVASAHRLAELYAEFAEEDAGLAEQGISEYLEGLIAEDYGNSFQGIT